MFITGLGTATPPRRYEQRECWDAVQQTTQLPYLTPRSRALLKKILTSRNGIDSRCLALDTLSEAFEISPDILHQRFGRHAPALAAQAADRALQDAEVASSAVDALIVSTCTGYLCPGLSSYVSQALGLRSDILAFDLVGQGCGAALPNLRMAEALLEAGRAQRVISVCVEICSAAFYLDDDPGVLVSACLFGDGAAAAVVAPSPRTGQRKVRWVTARSTHHPEERDLLRFEQKHGLLRNILSPCVPVVAARHARALLDQISAHGSPTSPTGSFSPGDIAAWILHAGGREVMAALQAEFGLSREQLSWSAEILRQFGNLSSPFVLFVLQAALAGGAPAGKWWMCSFGAGFSCHGAILEVE
jgi:alkylresorcinol/alkylpyrone synthase